ncbi:hypothetical protein QBD00_003339 [Ochrobactrum sp. AN78]|nr:hypothetical protein [Ochrobactrum sp. AN78]
MSPQTVTKILVRTFLVTLGWSLYLVLIEAL